MEIRQAMQLEFSEKHETIAKQRHTIMFNMSAYTTRTVSTA